MNTQAEVDAFAEADIDARMAEAAQAETDACAAMLTSAVECLRDIANMSKKVGSETAMNWLAAHGFARTAGGYIPGKGFENG